MNPLIFHIDRDFALDVMERCDSISLFRTVELPVRWGIFYELYVTFRYCLLNLRLSTLFQPGVEFRRTEFSVPLVC